MSILLAAKMSSFLSVNRSAKLQIISLLWQHSTPNSQKEHFAHLPTRGQCFPISCKTKTITYLMLTEHKKRLFLFCLFKILPGLGAARPGFVHSYVPFLSAAPQLGLIKGRYRLHSMCTKVTVLNYCYCTAAAVLLELENRNTSCYAANFQLLKFSINVKIKEKYKMLLEKVRVPGELTSRFDLWEEGSHLLALHNVRDDLTCYFGVGAICNNHRGATLQGPESSLDLQKNTNKHADMKVSTWHHYFFFFFLKKDE